jgi:hypothetical protein
VLYEKRKTHSHHSPSQSPLTPTVTIFCTQFRTTLTYAHTTHPTSKLHTHTHTWYKHILKYWKKNRQFHGKIKLGISFVRNYLNCVLCFVCFFFHETVYFFSNIPVYVCIMCECVYKFDVGCVVCALVWVVFEQIGWFWIVYEWTWLWVWVVTVSVFLFSNYTLVQTIPPSSP